MPVGHVDGQETWNYSSGREVVRKALGKEPLPTIGDRMELKDNPNAEELSDQEISPRGAD